MTDSSLIASIDQGTSSSRVVIFSTTTGEVVASHQIPVTPLYPASGWIELDADELYDTTLQCLNACVDQLEKKKIGVENVRGIGVTNQRETTIVWNRNTGQALGKAIVWSDARTANLAKKFTDLAPGKSPNAFQRKTGLPIHSYFSALKICWFLENIPAVAEASRDGSLLAGTVDTWIIWRLTNGKTHVTDVTNASRTLLFNLHTLNWDPQLCKFFGIDSRILPRIASSSEIVGQVSDPHCKLGAVKICGILGDQQASLVAQTWLTSSSDSLGPTVKVTFGTGAFMLWDIGASPFFSDNGILTTVAFQMGAKGQAHYALEGSVAFAGATLNWARNKMKLFSDYTELESMAKQAYIKQKENNPDPCYLVPAFSGLFCPWWQENARAVVAGLTADVEDGDLVYAAIRCAAYQTYDVLRVATLAEGSGSEAALVRPREIVVDGGMANSAVLMQSLADVLDMMSRRHNNSELMTALGSAVAAALALGIEPSGLLQLRQHNKTVDSSPHTFSPALMPHSRRVILAGWHAAVERSLGWVESASPNEGSDSLVGLLETVERRNSPKKKPRSISMSLQMNRRMDQFMLSVRGFTFILGLSLGLGILIGHWRTRI